MPFIGIALILSTFVYIEGFHFAKGQGEEGAFGLGKLFKGMEDIFDEALTSRNVTFHDTENLVNSSVFLGNPVSTSSESNVYLAWSEHLPNGKNGIFFKSSNDYGRNFDKNIKISDKVAIDSTPVLASSGDNVYAAWSYNTNVNNSILLRASNDKGHLFGNITMIGESSQPDSIQMLAKNNAVYVSWLEETNGTSTVKYRSSLDGGLSFGSTLSLDKTTQLLSNPVLLESEDDVDVLWSDLLPGKSNTYLAVSKNSGMSFDDKIKLMEKPRLTPPTIVSKSGDDIYLVWRDGSFQNSTLNLAIYNKVSRVVDKRVIESNGVGFDMPLLSSSDGAFYLVWQDPKNKSLIFMSGQANFTDLNSSEVLVSRLTSRDLILDLVSSGNNVYVIWGNTTGLFAKASTNGGKGFENEFKLFESDEVKNGIGFPVATSVSASGNNVYIFWKDLTITVDAMRNGLSLRAGSTS